ncbi:hypothetical protein IE991_29970 [Klebsiella pneumoniae]|uniref:Uncharacterized protein n=1 Tax=Klebsiella pneumoniae TaxID=573 RepID=A0A927DBV1_KLEPN|nr:hypothetical protein [Klebsiella pneumoniae]
MMITNKLLIEEVEELKNLLSQGKTEIPSFGSAFGPGVVLVAWNMLCAVISVDAVYLTGKYIFHVLVFPVGVSIIMLLGIASSRSLFLSVPKTLEKKSNIYRFFLRRF